MDCMAALSRCLSGQSGLLRRVVCLQSRWVLCELRPRRDCVSACRLLRSVRFPFLFRGRFPLLFFSMKILCDSARVLPLVTRPFVFTILWRSSANQFHDDFSGGTNNSLGLAFALLQASPEEFVVWRRFALLCSVVLLAKRYAALTFHVVKSLVVWFEPRHIFRQKLV